ncbi:MAG: L-serine ammonia-lyase, partial [Solirubrobacteraceae bacterium]
LFRVGVGPSSSHTVGPMRAAASFARRLIPMSDAQAVVITLHGSLALTARGHGTDRAILAGLLGHAPETVEPHLLRALDPEPPGVPIAGRTLRYTLRMCARDGPPGHPNAMRFAATDATGRSVLDVTFRSIGGGFITEDGQPPRPAVSPPVLDYRTGAELLEHAVELGAISAVAATNEQAWEGDVEARLLDIARTMDDCVERGLRAEGTLPGGLRVRRRAARLHHDLLATAGDDEPMNAVEWVSLWAMAVNEENAAGGRVVTAPTNGAAGVLPAVLRYARTFEHAGDDDIVRALLTAAAIGALIKRNASISGAEVGCQGEIGAAAAMAAAGLAEILGGDPQQVTNAAEIALEHHLGLTCDPIGGLVQIPCIERNAIGATKAITAAKLALRGDGQHVVSLDHVIDTMRRTGADMHADYKETSRGGLALNIPAC